MTILDIYNFVRSNGYAVCLFNPNELNGADPRQIEEAMCLAGWNAIEEIVGLPKNEEDEE
jgi:hypothetical protein